MSDVSVIICTHNPRRNYLDRAIDSLRKQTLPQERWELVVIDNASDRELSTELDLSWHPKARIVRENELGLTSARIRGMNESVGELIVFVDDDNFLQADYLATVESIMAKWSQIGAIGGSIVPEFEVEPRQEFRPFLGLLALREIKAPKWTNVAQCYEAEPWGAGMCIRRAVALAYVEHYATAKLRLSDRAGKSLLSSGDTEICMVACSCGWGMGVFPELKLTHGIPESRVQEDYIVRLQEGLWTSVRLVQYKWLDREVPSPFGILGIARIAKNLLARDRFNRRMYLADLKASVAARRFIKTMSTAEA